MVSLNVLIPVLETVFIVLYNTIYLNREAPPSEAIANLLEVSSRMVFAIQIASGVLLVETNSKFMLLCVCVV